MTLPVLIDILAMAVIAILGGMMFSLALNIAIHVALKVLLLLAILAVCYWVCLGILSLLAW